MSDTLSKKVKDGTALIDRLMVFGRVCKQADFEAIWPDIGAELYKDYALTFRSSMAAFWGFLGHASLHPLKYALVEYVLKFDPDQDYRAHYAKVDSFMRKSYYLEDHNGRFPAKD